MFPFVNKSGEFIQSIVVKVSSFNLLLLRIHSLHFPFFFPLIHQVVYPPIYLLVCRILIALLLQRPLQWCWMAMILLSHGSHNSHASYTIFLHKYYKKFDIQLLILIHILFQLFLLFLLLLCPPWIPRPQNLTSQALTNMFIVMIHHYLHPSLTTSNTTRSAFMRIWVWP